jgi:phosphohistidine phosphatase
MLLCLVQHAEALSKGEDPSRRLSEKGIADIKKVAAFAKELRVSAHQIVHSGKMRALQTAQILADHIAAGVKILESDGLAPMDDPEIWHDRISRINDDLMLVGHLPHLARLSALMLCGDKEMSAVNFEMGSIVCHKKSDDGNWAVDWIIKPRMLK